MAFSPTDRVRVINQHNQYRNHLGTVISVAGSPQDVQVRIDGHEATGEIFFEEADLGTSTLPSPIQY